MIGIFIFCLPFNVPSRGYPVFAELKHIVAVDVNQYYFVVAELDTVGFHAHFHAYEVVDPTTSTALAVVRYNTLADPNPLRLYRCTSSPLHLYIQNIKLVCDSSHVSLGLEWENLVLYRQCR